MLQSAWNAHLRCTQHIRNGALRTITLEAELLRRRTSRRLQNVHFFYLGSRALGRSHPLLVHDPRHVEGALKTREDSSH